MKKIPAEGRQFRFDFRRSLHSRSELVVRVGETDSRDEYTLVVNDFCTGMNVLNLSSPLFEWECIELEDDWHSGCDVLNLRFRDANFSNHFFQRGNFK